jgi:hypothetical protein
VLEVFWIHICQRDGLLDAFSELTCQRCLEEG